MNPCSSCEHWVRSRVTPERGGICSHPTHNGTRAARWPGEEQLYTLPSTTCDDWEKRRPRFGWVEEALNG